MSFFTAPIIAEAIIGAVKNPVNSVRPYGLQLPYGILHYVIIAFAIMTPFRMTRKSKVTSANL
jgi:hypothetical protein